MLSWLASARKALVTAVGIAITVLTAAHSMPFIPDQPLILTILGVLTTVATYLVPNAPAK
jgi:hypothetical protein